MNDAEKIRLEEMLKRLAPMMAKMAGQSGMLSDRVQAALDRALDKDFPLPRELTEKQMEVLLLKLITEQPASGFELISKLNKGLFRLAGKGEGAIYGLLANLESSGLLESDWRESSSRMVKLYRITEAGGLSLKKESPVHQQVGAWAEMLLRQT